MLRAVAEFLLDVKTALAVPSIAARFRTIAEANRITFTGFEGLLRSLNHKSANSLRWLVDLNDMTGVLRLDQIRCLIGSWTISGPRPLKARTSLTRIEIPILVLGFEHETFK